MSYALVAKVRAKCRGDRPRSPAYDSADSRATEGGRPYTRFLQKKSEKDFVELFLKSDVKDLQYYLSLWRGTKQLENPHRTAMQRVLGTEIDLQNILWAYRLKKYYGIFGDATYGFLVPVRHRLPQDVFSRMIQLQNAAGMQAVLSGTVYRSVFGDFSNAQNCLTNAVKARYRAEGRRSHIALLCGYLYEAYQ